MYLFAFPLCLEMKTVLTLWLKNPPAYTITFTQLALIDALVDSISYPLMTLAQATGKIKLYQGVVGGTLLCNLPVSYIALKLGAEEYAVMIIAICITLTALLIRLIIIKHLTKFSIKNFVQKAIFPCILVAFLSSLLPSAFSFHFAEGFFRLCATTFISLSSTTLCILFIGMNYMERKTLIASVKSKLRSTR